MSYLLDTLKQCADRLSRYSRLGQKIGEQNTKAGLIEPVIGALGWDVLDPEEVHREYRRRSTDNPVDYALLLMRTPRLFIEAKGLGENLDDPRWANQTISYATVAGVEWVALTDGVEWRIYNAHAPVPVEQKLFRTARITEDPQSAAELLALLSKDNMSGNRLQELWRSFFVDRQVHGALNDLFSDKEVSRELLDLLAKRVPDLQSADVRASLQRVRASFDFPGAGASSAPEARRPVASPSPTASPSARTFSGPSPSAQNASPRRKSQVGGDERRLRMADLMAAGRVLPGATIHADYMGQSHTAKVSPDGSIEYQGTKYQSLSAAGRAMKELVAGPGTPETTLATDGWGFWRAEDAVQGDIASLKMIRRRAAGSASGK
ncbi:hypothetical protein ACFV4E_00240 [Streptomyces hygroscopicus]|uniref:restriction system modified-DNA reader domain-containing protein n=1 Tax=Streptomyces hygroscopicus TaxID=1912 RepID=UPI0036A1096F